MDLEEKLKAKAIMGVHKGEVMTELKNEFYVLRYRLGDGEYMVKEADKFIKETTQLWKWIEQKIEDAITEYKSKLVEGQSSGEWQSILLINALRLLNDKERNELALSIIERTTPNLIDEAYKKQSLEITGMLDKMIDNFETTPTDKPIIRGIELTLAKLIKMNIEIQFLSSPKETLPSIKQDKLLTALSSILILPELPSPKEKL